MLGLGNLDKLHVLICLSCNCFTYNLQWLIKIKTNFQISQGFVFIFFIVPEMISNIYNIHYFTLITLTTLIQTIECTYRLIKDICHTIFLQFRLDIV